MWRFRVSWLLHHREGRLVLFVGAGASAASPSNLPLFEELAEEIARHTESVYPDDGSSPDQFLDRLQDEGVDVRRLVKKVIGRPGSEPNSLHRAIVALAGASGRFRVVTTNYDRHLSTCLPEPVEEYAAPAVPMRRDFGGIVYLHGSLRQDPELLVVTTTDFGEAYFNIPWATEFLKLMFRHSTVLFVGYSHSDVLMQYLGRALPPASKRYAFCKESQAEHWRRLGIKPVIYRQHPDLPRVIESWADQARMGMTDHAQRVREIVGGAPPLSREDQSYLEDTVAHPVRVRFFTDHARGLPWLRWMIQPTAVPEHLRPAGNGREGGNHTGRVVLQALRREPGVDSRGAPGRWRARGPLGPCTRSPCLGCPFSWPWGCRSRGVLPLGVACAS